MRELRIDVVTGHTFRYVLYRFSLCYVVEEYVRIGRDGIFDSRLFATGVGYVFTVGAPSKLFGSAEWLHRTFVRFALQQIFFVANGFAVEVCHERMRYALYPLVPMFVHKVVYYHTRCLRQVGIYVRCAFAVFYVGNEQYLFVVGRIDEVVDTTLAVGYLCAVATVGVHLPNLRRAAL